MHEKAKPFRDQNGRERPDVHVDELIIKNPPKSGKRKQALGRLRGKHA